MMSVNREKTYRVYISGSMYDRSYVVSGEDLEVENGNCRISKAIIVRSDYAVHADIMDIYDDDGMFVNMRADRDHDDDFPIRHYSTYKVSALSGEKFMAYRSIVEFDGKVHEDSQSALLAGAEERLPMIEKRKKRILNRLKRAKGFCRKRKVKRDLAYVEEVLKVYGKVMPKLKEKTQ